MIRSFALASLFAICASFASAASVRTEGSSVFVNEVRVLTVRTAGPIGRAESIAARLRQTESPDFDIHTTRKSSKVILNGEVLVTISKQEAARHGDSPAAVASQWVSAIRSAWSLPPIRISRDSFTLPVGGTGSVSMIGSEARTAPLAANGTAVANVSRKGPIFSFKAVAAGTTVFTVGEGDEAKTVTVKVWPYAAQFPQNLSASVVGAPTAANTVKSIVEGLLTTKLSGVEGTKWTWSAVTVPEIPTGERRTLAIKVRATAPEAFTSDGTVNVTLTNLGIANRRESELWYCNDPENVKKPQSLFRAELNRDDPVRLLYHHINMSGQPLYFRVLAVNSSDRAGSLVIMPGDSKDKNPVLAGVMATDPFFRAWLTGSGEVVNIPAHSTLPIAFRRLSPEETSSGLCYLRLLPGGPEDLTVTAEAVSPFTLEPSWEGITQSSAPWRQLGATSEIGPIHASTRSDQIYPQPFKQEEFVYRAGGNYSFYQIGSKPIRTHDAGRKLDGNFGVIYNITARSENPTSAPADVELVFEASAGYSGAIFSIDGQIVRLPLLQAKSEARLARFKLNPGESKSINVTTIPLSGSSYPATLVLRPVSSLPDLDYSKK